jgi:hypothetical protein
MHPCATPGKISDIVQRRSRPSVAIGQDSQTQFHSRWKNSLQMIIQLPQLLEHLKDYFIWFVSLNDSRELMGAYALSIRSTLFSAIASAITNHIVIVAADKRGSANKIVYIGCFNYHWSRENLQFGFYVRFAIGRAETNGKTVMIQRGICIAEVELRNSGLKGTWTFFSLNVATDPPKEFYLERPTALYKISQATRYIFRRSASQGINGFRLHDREWNKVASRGPSAREDNKKVPVGTHK